MKKIIIFAFGCILLLKPGSGQEVFFKASAPDSVGIKDTFYVIYKVNQKTSAINVKPFENFRQLSSPHTSFSSHFSLMNGTAVNNNQYIFCYELKPTAKGQFTIPQASVSINGKEYYSNALTIYVTDKPKRKESNSPSKITKDDLYIDVSLSKKEVFEQEAFLATLKLYSKYSITELSFLEQPAYDDFLSYDVSDSIIQTKNITINGKDFSFATLKKIVLYPQKSGMMHVSGGKIKCKIVLPLKKRTNQTSFDDFFEPNNKSIDTSLEITPVNILVKPLPTKEPANFALISGTNLELKASINKTSVKAKSPFSYEITLSGNGNLKMAFIPKINLPAEFEEMAHIVNNNLKPTEDGITGHRTFRYTIIPNQAGNFTIPDCSISYFDLDSHQYKTVSTQPVLINVKKGSDLPMNTKEIILPKQNTDYADDKNLIIVMDASSSMLAQDLKPNRLKASFGATKKFIQKQKGKAGLVIFSEDSQTKCPLTSNLNAISDSLNSISDLELGNGTAIGYGLSNAILELKESIANSKNIVLLTDGSNNTGSITPNMAARLAANYGIRIYTIGVAGKDSLAPYPVKTPFGVKMINMPIDIDEKKLIDISNITDAKYFRATDSASLDSVCKEIAKFIAMKSTDDKFQSNIPKDKAERILNAVSQDIDESREKIMKK